MLNRSHQEEYQGVACDTNQWRKRIFFRTNDEFRQVIHNRQEILVHRWSKILEQSQNNNGLLFKLYSLMMNFNIPLLKCKSKTGIKKVEPKIVETQSNFRYGYYYV